MVVVIEMLKKRAADDDAQHSINQFILIKQNCYIAPPVAKWQGKWCFLKDRESCPENIR